jgi:hypothetical protein
VSFLETMARHAAGLVACPLAQLEASDVIARKGVRVVIHDRVRLTALARGEAEAVPVGV